MVKPSTGDENVGDGPKTRKWPPDLFSAMTTCAIGHGSTKKAIQATEVENVEDGPKT